MALSMQVILAGAMATHRIEQIEEQRRDLMRRHEDERAAIGTEAQEIERLRADLERRAQALQSSQQDLAARHESERDASTGQLQQANTEFAALIDESVKQSGRKPEELTKLFNGQLEILIATGNLSEDLAIEIPTPREVPARARTERTYRRSRKGQGEDAVTATAPGNGAGDEETAATTPSEATEQEPQEPLAAAPAVQETSVAESAPVDVATPNEPGPNVPGGTAEAQPDTAPVLQPLRSIADEGGAIDDAVAALANTPASVVLTDGEPEPALADHFFADIHREMPPTAVSGRSAALPTETNPATAPEADGGPDLGLDGGPDLGATDPGPAQVDILDLDLPGHATATPSGASEPAAATDDLDEFDRLERDFGGSKDVDFEIPKLLR